MKKLTMWLVALTLSVLVGCASLGLSKPQSFDEQLANAYGVHTAVLSTTSYALTRDVVSSTDATMINAQAQNARALLDAAHAAEAAGDLAGANSKLALALSVLTSLQTFINSKTGGP